MPLRNTFPEHGTKTGGIARLLGAFVCNGASAPAEASIVGEGFTVSAPATGVYTVTLTDGPAKGVAFACAHLARGGANNTKRASVLSDADLTVGGTFTIVTQSTAGTDANLSASEVVFFEVCVINQG